MAFKPRCNSELVLPYYNLMINAGIPASDLMRLKDFTYQYNYSIPAKVERVQNQPMTDKQRSIYQREHRVRYFRKTPVYNAAPVYFDNPAFNAYMDATRPIRPEPRAKVTCSRCWRVVVKHLERVRNNIVVNLRKKINC
ncbi:hypothetical protein [Candidatus Symbiopectobacterium sp. NZEC135]|uniref:hypothetical protein n=1 Tax=Candidatus Symbiopectobacterium sp. NZEC135 TaxID=2820471 RepID=UPI002227A103|nr:hypothetical protein [Candidatus Symbiopectobacterium sp. NZEC135]MCW2478391.1 hypothetical protein [Candidatus Symbiopectobacterium sp. NZEC135]